MGVHATSRPSPGGGGEPSTLLARAEGRDHGAVAGRRGHLWFDGYRDFDVVGPAFLRNAVAGTVIAVLLMTWRHWVPAFLVTGFGASTLGAFVIAATVGLFGVEE